MHVVRTYLSYACIIPARTYVPTYLGVWNAVEPSGHSRLLSDPAKRQEIANMASAAEFNLRNWERMSAERPSWENARVAGPDDLWVALQRPGAGGDIFVGNPDVLEDRRIQPREHPLRLPL